jgi:uncharacterized protein (DUF1330 family)
MQERKLTSGGNTMAVYLIANVKVTDDAWIPNYAANVHAIVHKHGGEYLSRSANITSMEGDAPDTTLIAVIKFPSMKAAQGFANDPDYAPYGEARRAGSDSQFYIIDDTDVAGTIDYLPSGAA